MLNCSFLIMVLCLFYKEEKRSAAKIKMNDTDGGTELRKINKTKYNKWRSNLNGNAGWYSIVYNEGYKYFVRQLAKKKKKDGSRSGRHGIS